MLKTLQNSSPLSRCVQADTSSTTWLAVSIAIERRSHARCSSRRLPMALLIKVLVVVKVKVLQAVQKTPPKVRLWNPRWLLAPSMKLPAVCQFGHLLHIVLASAVALSFAACLANCSSLIAIFPKVCIVIHPINAAIDQI